MDTAVVTFLVNAGMAGVVVFLLLSGILVTGREHKRLEGENDALKQALSLERQRNADMLVWASTGAKALQAVAQVAQERAPEPAAPENGASP